jgi:hypothetical protein
LYTHGDDPHSFRFRNTHDQPPSRLDGTKG